MMKDKIIDFSTAKLAKEKGFGLGKNDYVMLPTVYELNGSLYNNGELTGTVVRKYTDSPNHLGADTRDDFKVSVFCLDNSLDEYILAPTQSLLQKWLREIHKIELWVSRDTVYNEYKCTGDLDDSRGNIATYFHKTFEEALEKGLQKALKLIKWKSKNLQ